MFERIFNKNTGILVLATLLSTAAFAGGIPFTQDVSGAIATTQTDTDGDLLATTSIGQLGGTSTLGGEILAQTVTELAGVPGANTDCLPSEVQFPFVYVSAVERLIAPNALIYFALDPVAGGYSCVDPLTGALNGTINLVIIGGTGPATGASGGAAFDFSGVPVGVAQTALTGTVTGTLVLP